jgi:hypothetical protein
MLALIQTEPKAETGAVTRVDLAALDRLDAEAVAVFCFSDVRPLAGAAGFLDWRMCGSLSSALERRHFEGLANESMLVPCRGRLRVKRVFVFGLGEEAALDTSALAETCRRASATMQKAGVQRLVFLAPAARRKGDVERSFVKVVSEELPGQIAEVLVEQAG